MTQQTKPSNGRRPSIEPLSDAQLQSLLLPLARKVSWAIGSTFYDITGDRLPRKMVDNTADTIATEFLTSLRTYLKLTQ